MASLNRATLIGNVGKDPDSRFLPDGTATATIGLATTDRWKDKTSGELNERTEWHRVVFYGKLAEVVRDYVRKGSLLYVEGQIRTRKWQDQRDNINRYTTEIHADQMQMLDKKPHGAAAAAATDETPGGNFEDSVPY